MLVNKYNLIEKINEGTFGTIYKGINIRSNEYVAIKVETNIDLLNSLKNEARIYHYLGKIDGFPQLKWFGKQNELTYLVVDLLGSSLKQIIKNYKVLRLKSVLQLGIQMISRIQNLHEKKLIHRDIKPDNFLIGLNNNSNKLYLIDFGFCKNFMKNNNHMNFIKTTKIIGTLNFVSLNVQNYFQPSRRDDIESCIYIILYLYFGKLEWEYLSDEFSIYKLKEQLTIQEDVPMFIKIMLCYVRELLFDEIPDYKYLIEILEKMLRVNNFINDNNNFEWSI